MPEVLVATPLNSAVSKAYNFSQGISIRELSPIHWDVSNVKSYITDHEMAKLKQTQYWMCAAKEYPGIYSNIGDELYAPAWHAAMALQVIHPAGAKHIFLKFWRTPHGWDNIGSQCRHMLSRVLPATSTSAENCGLADQFDAVYSGIQRAFAEKVIRVENPILLLEQGMQVGHVYLSGLMFAMALDMLFMAGETSTFIERIGKFLGTDLYIFPRSSLTSQQPKTTVGEVLHDLYGLRNVVAHGREIPKQPYRELHPLISTSGNRINFQDYHYAELMRDSGLFMLTTALRRIFIEDLFDVVANPKEWRRTMKGH